MRRAVPPPGPVGDLRVALSSGGCPPARPSSTRGRLSGSRPASGCPPPRPPRRTGEIRTATRICAEGRAHIAARLWPASTARRTRARAGRARRSPGRRRSLRAARRACRAPRSPSSRTTISSASAIVDRRCAMISVVRPCIASRSPSGSAPRSSRRRTRCVVEDQDARVDDQRARDRDPLALTPESVMPRSPITVS